MKARYLFVCIAMLAVLAPHFSFGQHDEHTPTETEGISHTYYIPRDTGIHTLLQFFSHSHFHGHIRNYLMATVNHGHLNDYWTNATGGALKYETPMLYGLQLGVKGIFTYRMFSSSLEHVDTTNGINSAWELELYDVQRPNERRDLDRLEELYLKFNFGKSFVTYGKIDINKGPLFMRKDDRMKPFVYRGLWGEINEWGKQTVNFGWIIGVSPRGMTEWLTVDEAIGVLDNGYHPDGTEAEYHEAIHSKGIGVLSLQSEAMKNWKLQYWGFWFHNLFFMNWMQADYDGERFFGGTQLVLQNADGSHHELDYNERYIHKGEIGAVVSTKAGVKLAHKQVMLSGAYLHSFKGGRFLFPRELGKENFYVSQPRSWIDGYGDLDVYMLEAVVKPHGKIGSHFLFDTKVSYFNHANLTEYQHNKYKLTSYFQGVVDVVYHFDKLLKGLDFEVLYVARHTIGSNELEIEDIYYKTNFHNFNFIANIYF